MKYDAEWQMNLINGFLIVWPTILWGAMMYAMLKNGKRMPILIISSAWRNIFFLRNPGRPSYQIDANSCCTLGCATNWKYPGNAILTDSFGSCDWENVIASHVIRIWIAITIFQMSSNYYILTNVLYLYYFV